MTSGCSWGSVLSPCSRRITGSHARVVTGRIVVASLVLVSPFLLWVQVYQGIGDYVRQALAVSRREASRSNWFQLPGFGVDGSNPFLSRLAAGPVVNVRWQPDATEARIVEAETRHGLARREQNSPQSWSYTLTRWSAPDLQALVSDPLAADTHGIDRAGFALQVPAPQGFAALFHMYGPGEGLPLSANAFAALVYLFWLLPAGAIAALVYHLATVVARVAGHGGDGHRRSTRDELQHAPGSTDHTRARRPGPSGAAALVSGRPRLVGGWRGLVSACTAGTGSWQRS